MRSVICTQLGPLEENVAIHEVEVPVAGPGQIVVSVRAAGVNYVDGLMCQGRYQIKFPTPYVPGGEIAGVVTSVGHDAGGFSPGDRVMALTGFGAFTEEIAIPALSAVRMPRTISFGQGATMIQSYATALYAFKRAQLTAGECVLVLGAGGGIGLAAIDLAVALGARAIGAASSRDKLAAATQMGAVGAIAYEDEDLKLRARELSNGGVDVVIDPVGGPKSEAALRSLQRFGRLCVIGFTSGSIGTVPLNQVLLSNRSVIGIDWGAWASSDPLGNLRLIEEFVEMVDQGKLHPVVPVERSLDSAVAAMDDLLERRVVGKVVLVP
ncbi:MAG: NADPH:quinone oxidoreductase family protein [Acidimicrobiales bacterium]|jgi:NADPH2:quinone reductase